MSRSGKAACMYHACTGTALWSIVSTHTPKVVVYRLWQWQYHRWLAPSSSSWMETSWVQASARIRLRQPPGLS